MLDLLKNIGLNDVAAMALAPFADKLKGVLGNNPAHFRRAILDALCDLNETLGMVQFKRAITIIDEETLRESAEHNGFDFEAALNARNRAIADIQAFADICRKR